jgi:hypothetical protein
MILEQFFIEEKIEHQINFPDGMRYKVVYYQHTGDD